MSFSPLLDLTARLLRSRSSRTPRDPARPRILVIRRNRMGDMICTLPLLQALRRHHPQAHLTVACDPPGAPIAGACDAVDDVVVLETGWNRWLTAIREAARLQGYDWVIAAKGGFDRRLALLTRLTNGTRRIGFETQPGEGAAYFTDRVAMPPDPHVEHQIETQLRLLGPLGIPIPAFDPGMLRIPLPGEARETAALVFAAPPFARHPDAVLLNLSSNRTIKFTLDDYAALIRRLLAETSVSIGLISMPHEHAMAQKFAELFPGDRVTVLATPRVIDLAALLECARALVTPEGGAGHLASIAQTPAVVLWSEGPHGKWRPRGKGQVTVEALEGEPRIPVERVWAALKPLL